MRDCEQRFRSLDWALRLRSAAGAMHHRAVSVPVRLLRAAVRWAATRLVQGALGAGRRGTDRRPTWSRPVRSPRCRCAGLETRRAAWPCLAPNAPPGVTHHAEVTPARPP